jgi:uncharacterized membrane protein
VDASFPASAKTYTAMWEEKSDEWVTVTFVNADSSQGTFGGTLVFKGIIGASTPVIVAPSTTPVYGYMFAGWDTTVPSVYPSSDLTITGSWLHVGVDQFFVTYFGNGASGGVVPVDYNWYGYGDRVTVLGAGSLVRAGYSFLGWSTSSFATVAQYTAGSTFYIYADVDLYAVWVQSEFTVTYEPGAHGTFTAQVTSGLYYGDATPAAPAAPAVTGEVGWNFTGWLPAVSATVTGDATYVAQWSQMPSSDPTPTPSVTVPPPTATPVPPVTTATPTPSVTTAPTGTPDTRIPPTEVFRWAVVNLILAVLGVVLAVVVFVRALLLKKMKGKDDKRNGAGSTAGAERFVHRRLVWLVAVLVFAVVGVVVFFVTEDMGLSMGWVDKWTIVNAIILVVEIMAVMFVFHNKKAATNNTDKNRAQTTTTATSAT